MKYDKVCSASDRVSNNVTSFNGIWRENMYNCKQHVTKKQQSILPESAPNSRKTMIAYCISCKYVIQLCLRSYFLLFNFNFLHNDVQCICECIIFLWGYSA